MALEKYSVQLSTEDRADLERLIRSGSEFGAGHKSSAHFAQDRPRLERIASSGGFGYLAPHGVPHQTSARCGGLGRRAARPSPGQPVSQAG